MKKVLFLFDKKSLKSGADDAARLVDLVQNARDTSMQVDQEILENLLFFVSEKEAVITSNKLNKKPLEKYDAIYFRRINPVRPLSLATAIYLRKKNVSFIDQEAYTERFSLTKLSQLFRLWEHDLPIPKTIFGISGPDDMWFFRKHLGRFPVVVKAIMGARGSHNYLANDEKEVVSIIQKYPDQEFLVQEFIPNQEDYRLIVVNDDVKMVIKRTRDAENSHKNNISLGAKAAKIPTTSLSPAVLRTATRAARALDRNFAGVDIVISEKNQKCYLFEVNRAPQITNSSFEKEKARILRGALEKLARKTPSTKQLRHPTSVIGQAERIDFPSHKQFKVPARIDTGAKTSAIWVSNLAEKNGELSFELFGPASKYHTGERLTFKQYSHRVVSNSFGHRQVRYTVRLSMVIGDRPLRATFTLADRSQQIYPILIGRNILRGKFTVDVTQGKPLVYEERAREEEYERQLFAVKRKGKS